MSHYFIDGYNLLFRSLNIDDALQEHRERLIQDLRAKVELLNLHLTLVFDSQYQWGEATFARLGELHVVFTAQGETADERILTLLKDSSSPQKQTIVTSDKRLAWKARRLLARTETIEEFLSWLNKRYYNRLRKMQREKLQTKPAPKPASPPISKKKPKPSPNATLAECFDYYLQIFQERFDHN